MILNQSLSRDKILRKPFEISMKICFNKGTDYFIYNKDTQNLY